MTRDDLRRIYDEAVARHGRSAAVAAVEAATGLPYLSETPDDKLAATASALRSIGRPSVHARLDAMATAIYSKK
jgi:hypothetical protein